MATGERYMRAAYGQTLGESKGIQEHQLAMIPIIEKKAASELEIKSKAFAQEIEQAEKLSLLAQQLEDQQPVFVPAAAPATAPAPGIPKNIIYIGLGILAFLLFRKK